MSDLKRWAKNMKTLCLVSSLVILFVAGCATKVQTPNTKVPEGFVDVWLIPMEGMPENDVRYFTDKLTHETGLIVRATVEAGKSAQMYDTASKQIIAQRILYDYKTLPKHLDAISAKTVYIVLTTDDLNDEERRFRFVFMSTAPSLRMSVVSMARMRDSFYGAPDTPFRTRARMYKMVKKAVGLLYYEYSRSSDRNTVMYSPIMGLDDLDAIGTNYK